ncbi:MAG: nucleotidyltransferase domain-containing protein [Candidatus Lindowbacteria bacterium]|nr:nucleotidyltransferase domain-containing protein [Candidatus Lindowbacteria bacterium]
MNVDESTIQEIVRRILTVTKPEKVILFGSAATGAMTSDSDVDLLVVELDPGDRQEKYVRIRRALRGMGFPFDIILISKEWFEESKDVIGGIAYPASKHGKVIYEAA